MKGYLKKTILLYFVFSTFQLNGQEASYRVQAEAVALPVLIDLLEKSYNVRFSYPSDLVEKEVFYLKTNTPDLTDILKEITAIYPIEYQILDNKSILLRAPFSKKEEGSFSANTVSFIVLDSQTNEPLESAALGIRNTSIGDYSNERGEITLMIPPDKLGLKLEIHMLGYEYQEISWNKLDGQIIKLKPQIFSIEEVMVQDRMDILKVGKTDHSVILKTEHISALASGVIGQDVLRQAQLLPGVAAFDDQSAGLKIRGADEASSLIVLDDIPIYNASHYYGLFSSINPNYTTSSILYKNNLPVEYDGKTAGMLQINGPTSKMSNKTNGSLDINLLTMSGAINTLLSKKLTLSVGARTTYQNVSDTDLFSLFNSPAEEEATVENFSLSSRDVLLSTVPDFTFFDVVGKLRYSFEKGYLEFNYFQSEDDLDDSFSNEFRTRRANTVVINNEFYSNTESWKNRGFNLKLETELSQTLSLTSVAYISSYENKSGLDIGLSRTFLREEVSKEYSNFRSNDVRDIGFKSVISSKLGPLEWSGGIDIVQHDVSVGVSEDNIDIINIEEERTEKSLFVATQMNIGKKTRIELGLRGTSFNNKIYPSPRLNVAYQHTDKWAVKASVGRHNQFVRQLSFENTFGRSLDFWILSDDDRLQVSSADQVMLGTTYKNDHFTLDIESYARVRYDLLEQALFDPRFDQVSIFPLSRGEGNEYRLFTGDGKTLGIDLTLGLTYPKYSGWLTYTLSKSTIEYDQILRGTAFPTQDDRRHQIKWVNEYRLGAFTLGANVVYASGKPYTDLNKVTSSLRRDQLTPEARISRLPDYIRTDLGITYDFKIDQTNLKLGLSAYNLLNRQNVNYIQYLFSIPTNSATNPNATIRTLLGTESALLDRTVNISLKVNF